MKLDEPIKDYIASTGDDVVTALLICIGLACIIVAVKGNLGLKVAWIAYLGLP